MGPFDLIKQAKKFQETLKDMQTEMEKLEIIGIAGAGLVKITMNGQYQTRHVFIDESLLKEDKKVIEELIQAALLDVVTKISEAQKNKMGGMMSGFGLPMNGLNFPFMSGKE